MCACNEAVAFTQMMSSQDDLPVFEALPKREQQVLNLAAEGFTDRHMAEELGISSETIATYWRRILVRYRSSSRTQVIARVMQRRMEDLVFTLTAAAPAEPTHANLTVRAIRDFLPTAMLLEATSGQVVFANSAMAQKLGFGDSLHLIGRTMSDLLDGHPLAKAHSELSGKEIPVRNLILNHSEGQYSVHRIPVDTQAALWIVE